MATRPDAGPIGRPIAVGIAHQLALLVGGRRAVGIDLPAPDRRALEACLQRNDGMLRPGCSAVSVAVQPPGAPAANSLLEGRDMVLADCRESVFRMLDDLVKLARDTPGKDSYASSGTGSSGHMAMEMFKQRAGLKIEHVPYKGGAQALQDVLGGQVPILITNADAVLPHIKSGKLKRAGGYECRTQSPVPDTPTIAEQGFPGFAAVSWTGISAPARTPPCRRGATARRGGESLEQRRAEEAAGGCRAGGRRRQPEDDTRFVAAEAARWAEVARSAGITVDRQPAERGGQPGRTTRAGAR